MTKTTHKKSKPQTHKSLPLSNRLQTLTTSNSLSPKPAVYSIPKNILHIFLILFLFAILTIAYFARNLIFAATVNGQPISRIKLIKELESQGGQQVLDRMIIEELILQAARKKNLTVPAEDIQSELTTIEANFTGEGASFEEVLAAQGFSRTDLESQIRINKLIDQLIGVSTNITEEQIDTFIQENQDFFQTKATPEEQRQTALDQLTQQAKQKQVQDLIAGLKAEAQINYLLNL